MANNISDLICDLQNQEALPSGKVTIKSWAQPASRIHEISLGSGYYVKEMTMREGINSEDQQALEQQFVREVKALQELTCLFENTPQFCVPKLVFSDKGRLLLVTEALQGDSLQEVCALYSKRFSAVQNNAEEACFRLGQLLNLMHKKTERPLEASDVDILLKYIKEKITEEFFSQIEINQLNDFCIQSAENVVRNLEKHIKCFVHHDLNPTNIFVSADSLGMLDFADTTYASPYQDLVYFPLMLKGQFSNFIKYRSQLYPRFLKCFYNGYETSPEQLSSNKMYILLKLKNLLLNLTTYNQLLKSINRPKGVGELKRVLVYKNEIKTLRKSILRIVSV